MCLNLDLGSDYMDIFICKTSLSSTHKICVLCIMRLYKLYLIKKVNKKKLALFQC